EQLQKNLGLIADAAFLQDKGGRDALPPDLRLDQDRIVQAFQQLESGQDDKARETLGLIGLRSPYAEWKVFLRGLQAYYQNDDQRALDDWQRLDSGRLPVRLAAPFRASIDPVYMKAQPGPVQNLLRQQIEFFQGGGFGPMLRSLRESLAN